jgi:hypothetical protein
MARLRHADGRCRYLFLEVERKLSVRGQNDAFDPGCVKTLCRCYDSFVILWRNR